MGKAASHRPERDSSSAIWYAAGAQGTFPARVSFSEHISSTRAAQNPQYLASPFPLAQYPVPDAKNSYFIFWDAHGGAGTIEHNPDQISPSLLRIYASLAGNAIESKIILSSVHDKPYAVIVRRVGCPVFHTGQAGASGLVFVIPGKTSDLQGRSAAVKRKQMTGAVCPRAQAEENRKQGKIHGTDF